MNIFVVDTNPVLAAKQLPERHIVKMPLECTQMLSLVLSPWYLNLGSIKKVDGSVYKTDKGSHRNHPCTKWAARSLDNTCWLLVHGVYLCIEYSLVYDGRQHGCYRSLTEVTKTLISNKLVKNWEEVVDHALQVKDFIRAMPDDLKNDLTISTPEAYQKFICRDKPWAKHNYKRRPHRKPAWLI